MSVFYDLASLVLVPSGYKASKVYAQKPLTTDGQLAFSRASTATRVNSAGLIETVSSNVPRLDYLGSTCPKLLLEPQRTNLLTYSEAFNVGGVWDENGVTVTADTTVSPDGVQNADTINATIEGQRINQTVTVSASTQYTFSFYAKKGTMATPRYSVYDLSNNAFILTQVNYTSLVNTSTWSRITATFTTPSGCTSIAVYPINGASTGTIFLWGAMLEQGAYPTSYVKTEGTTVTRLADAASKTGISSLIGQTEGTLFADITIPTMANTGSNLVSISLFNAGLTNVTIFDIYDTGGLFAVHVNGTAQASIQKTGFTAGRHKVAFGYKANDFVLYVDGALVGTDTSGTVGAQDSFGLQYGTSQFIGQQYVSQALVFKTRLTNAQLAELTTL